MRPVSLPIEDENAAHETAKPGKTRAVKEKARRMLKKSAGSSNTCHNLPPATPSTVT